MAQTAWEKYRDSRLAAGGCIWCRNPAVPGRKFCQQHLDVEKERQARKRAARKKAHLCTDCGTAPPEPGKARCRLCNLSMLEANRRHRAKRKALGLCPRCGKHKPKKGRVYCSICLGKYRTSVYRTRERKEKRETANQCRRQFRLLLSRNPDGVIERLAGLIKGRPKHTAAAD